MFEKLTPRMSRVIELSQHIARDYDQEYVGTEHLLLAMLQEGTGAAAEILRERGITYARAKKAVDELIHKSLEDTWVFGRLPGTPHFRNVMAKAIEESRQLESNVVCTEHLLLALAREEGSVAQATLTQLGLRTGVIRQDIIKRLDHACEEADAAGPVPPDAAE
jgi:ATP-dependent Clp protease ATP-binding subunit ClpC